MSRFHRWLVESASGLTLILILTACSHLPGGELDVAAVKLKLRSEPSAFRLEGRVSVKAGEESCYGIVVCRPAFAG